MNQNQPVIHTTQEIMGGTAVFVGTRVPFETLLDYLEAGQPLSESLEDFPTVTREQAVAALEQARGASLRRDRVRPMTTFRRLSGLPPYVNCWIRADDAAEAEERARQWIADEDWVVVSVERAAWSISIRRSPDPTPAPRDSRRPVVVRLVQDVESLIARREGV
jgi:uncharacterized protein (DUF433 family)